MTKADMIETLITDAVEKQATMKLYQEVLGKDKPATKIVEGEWSAMYNIIKRFNLIDQYIEKKIEQKIA